jgi:hypothetical protein
MYQMRYAWSATLIFLAGAPVVSSAQTIPSPYTYVEDTQSLSVFGGYLWTGRGDTPVGPHSAPLGGIAYTMRFTGPVSGEASFATVPTRRTLFEREVVDDSVRLNDLGEVESILVLAEAGVRLHLTGPRHWNGLAPYVAGSVGLANDYGRSTAAHDSLPAAEQFNFGPGFAIGIAAGTDWFLTPRLALRVEARDRLWRLTIPQGLNNQLREETEWTHNAAVTIGAALYF